MELDILSPTDDYGDIDGDLCEQAETLARLVNMGITRDREFTDYIVDSDQNMIAAAWSSFDGDNYEFDIVVAPSHQGLGLGSKLLNKKISDFGECLEMNQDATMNLHVTSEKMKGMLEKLGFTDIQSVQGGSYIISKPNQEDDSKPSNRSRRGLR